MIQKEKKLKWERNGKAKSESNVFESKKHHFSVQLAYRTGRDIHQFTSMINPTVRQKEEGNIYSTNHIYMIIPTTYEVNEVLSNYSVKCREEYNS